MEAEETGPAAPEHGIRRGVRRATLHWIRAGYELVAGVGALLDELLPRKQDESGDATVAPVKIELED